MHFQHRHRGNTRGNVSPSLFLDWCIRVYSRRYFARGGLGGRHCRQDTVPAPRILQGPFRNVDPHTTSLAVYFRGPASELFNMLNPESPGAISVLARTCIYIYTHLCILSEPHPASVCVCVCTRRETTYARLYVEAIYIYIYITGTKLGHVRSVCWYSPLHERAIGHVLNRATLRQLADREKFAFESGV